MFREDAYLDKSSGYRLRDYFYRTIRQRIRKLLGEEGVEPEDWSKSRAAGFISAPGDKRTTGCRIFEAPRGSPMKNLLQERAKIRVEFSKNKSTRKDLPQLGAIKFGQFNYTSRNIKPQDLSRTAKTTLGNGVRESILPPTYKSFPDEAMTRFAQERGLLRHKEIVKVPKPVIVCQGTVRQVPKLPGSKISVPTRTLINQDWKERELVQLAEIQKEEQKVLVEPTTLAGAVRSLNRLNDGRATAAQQRLKSRGAAILDRSDSSVEFIAEIKGNPERERREKPVVRSTPPVMDRVVTPAVQAAEALVDVLDEDGDSDDPDRDKIVMQRLKVKLEMDRLAKYEAAYVLKMESRRRRR
jgi:hypothetical protein